MTTLPASLAIRRKGRRGDTLTFGGSRKGTPEFCLGKDCGVLPSSEALMPAWPAEALGGGAVAGPFASGRRRRSLATFAELGPVSESPVASLLLLPQAPSLSQTGVNSSVLKIHSRLGCFILLYECDQVAYRPRPARFLTTGLGRARAAGPTDDCSRCSSWTKPVSVRGLSSRQRIG